MDPSELEQILTFPRATEQLKDTHRNWWMPSVGEHELRLCLMAMLLAGFDYRFNLDHGKRYTAIDSLITTIPEIRDRDTGRRANGG